MVHNSHSKDISAFAAICRARVLFLIFVLTCAAISLASAQGTNPIPSLSSANPTQALAGATVPITLSGTGFVSSTVILVNGAAVPTTYQSSTAISAQITAAAGSSGNLAVQAQSPTPGGGTSATMQLSIATLQITATDPDGTNTGTAQLGVPVTLTTSNTDTAHNGISWTLQGGGKIGTTSVNGAAGALGTYTPPQTMPSSSSVTITAYLTNLPALTTSYSLNLVNPTLTVTSSTQTQLLTGGTQEVNLFGSGFVPGTTVTLNGVALTTNYVSYGIFDTWVPVGNTATGTLTLQIQNPAPGSGVVVPFSLPIAVNSIALAPTSQTGPVVALGGSIKMGATVTGSMQTAVTWSVSGGGTITTGGTYVAPTTMPTGSVIITAALTSNPAITASYPLTLDNAVPVVNNSSPTQALAGGAESMTLTGTAFVPGTVILVNGTAVPTTYNSPTSVVAQITGPAGSSANLSVQAQNPSPGGGTGAAFQMPVATLQLTATNSNGTNTGTDTLGVPINFSAVNTDTAHTGVLWTLQGAGTLNASGFANGANNLSAVYTPPAQMPANASVTVIAYLQSLPALTTSYTFQLTNSALVVTSATPTQAETGGTQTVTLIGSGFVAGTTVSLNGTALPVTNISNTQEAVQVPVAANATGTLTLQVQNPASGTVVPFSLPIAVNSIALAPTTQTGPVVALGSSLGMGATVTGSILTAVTWSVVGDGTISSTGTYVAPATMTTGSAVITAALTSNPSITASYPLTLVNPAPLINNSNPTQALAGGAESMTLTGTGFVPGTVILVNGTAVPTTYSSATSIVAQITGPAGSSANLSVLAQNPSPGGGTSAAIQIPVATLQLTATNPSGTNTGTAMLGVPVNFSAVQHRYISHRRALDAARRWNAKPKRFR